MLVSSCFATALAQDGGSAAKKPEPPPPPPPAAEYSPQSWKEFSSAQGRFAALFPGTPAEQTEAVDTASGKIDMHTVSLSSVAFYVVAYSDFPFNLEEPETIKQNLDNGRDMGVKGVDGRLLEEKEITVEGHPGRYLKVQAGNGGIIRSKIIIVGNRNYTLVVVTNDQGAPEATLRFHEEIASKFHDSFKLKAEQKVAI
jgi:hypothetical protein